jgi:Bax protein
VAEIGLIFARFQAEPKHKKPMQIDSSRFRAAPRPKPRPLPFLATLLALAVISANFAPAGAPEAPLPPPPAGTTAPAPLTLPAPRPDDHALLAPDAPGSLPAGLGEMRDVAARKSLFIETVLPAIKAENAGLAEQRARAESLIAAREAGSLGPDDAAELARLEDRYGAAHGDSEALLRRLDTVPVSLALAQAIIESGWGTSRFAREGNALYGQRDWSGSGLVPSARPDGAGHSIRAFPSIRASVAAYMHNLNTHPAYRELRMSREALRRQGAPLSGAALADTLLAYSTRGEDYVSDVKTIIRQNRLQQFDSLSG